MVTSRVSDTPPRCDDHIIGRVASQKYLRNVSETLKGCSGLIYLNPSHAPDDIQGAHSQALLHTNGKFGHFVMSGLREL